MNVHNTKTLCACFCKLNVILRF